MKACDIREEIDSGDRERRGDALHYLLSRSKPAMRFLRESLSGDVTRHQFTAVVNIMSRTPPEFVPLIVDLLRRSPDRKVRGVCSYILWHRQDPAHTDAFLRALDDPDDHVRRIAAMALIGIGHVNAARAKAASFAERDKLSFTMELACHNELLDEDVGFLETLRGSDAAKDHDDMTLEFRDASLDASQRTIDETIRDYRESGIGAKVS